MPAILHILFHKVRSQYRGRGWGWWVATKWLPLPIQKFICMAKWHQVRLFLAPHITNIATSMHSLTSQSCLIGQASWRHLKTTRAPVDARQAHKRGLSKSRPLSFRQRYIYTWTVSLLLCLLNVVKWDLTLYMYKTLLANLVTHIYTVESGC